MSNYSYLSLDKLKADMGIAAATTTNDAALRDLLETVTQQFDIFVERTFRILTATRYYTGGKRAALDLGADLLTVTSLKTLTANTNGTRTYGDTWATTDYDLAPANAAVDRHPYTRIEANIGGAFWFPWDQRGVEIVGKWGYWEDLETLTSTTTSAVNATVTTLPITTGTEADVLDTLQVDSEQMYVTAISSNNLTVVRGVNGTTAASHLITAVVQRHLFPSPIARATGIQAARLFNRARHSPTGTGGSPEMGLVRPVRLDADIKALIEPYRYGRA